MIKVPISLSTRKKALEALQSLESEKLIELAKVSPIAPYYEKNIQQAMQKDAERAKEWINEPSVSIVPARERKGPSEAQKILSLISRYEPIEVPKYGRPGKGRISHEVNHATELIVGSAKAQGDTLHVKQPKLDMTSKKAKEALEEVFSPAGGESAEGDGGTGGYGF